MDNLTLNIYDDEGNVVKTSEAEVVGLKFGTVRSLMKLLNVDNIDDTTELLQTVCNAWEKVTSVLSQCFPDITDDEWDNVDMRELVVVIIKIMKSAFQRILEIPVGEEKN